MSCGLQLRDTGPTLASCEGSRSNLAGYRRPGPPWPATPSCIDLAWNGWLPTRLFLKIEEWKILEGASVRFWLQLRPLEPLEEEFELRAILISGELEIVPALDLRWDASIARLSCSVETCGLVACCQPDEALRPLELGERLGAPWSGLGLVLVLVLMSRLSTGGGHTSLSSLMLSPHTL